jgi:hypothetical protein
LKTFSTLNPPPNPSKKPLEPQLLGYDAVVVSSSSSKSTISNAVPMVRKRKRKGKSPRNANADVKRINKYKQPQRKKMPTHSAPLHLIEVVETLSAYKSRSCILLVLDGRHWL